MRRDNRALTDLTTGLQYGASRHTNIEEGLKLIVLCEAVGFTIKVKDCGKN